MKLIFYVSGEYTLECQVFIFPSLVAFSWDVESAKCSVLFDKIFNFKWKNKFVKQYLPVIHTLAFAKQILDDAFQKFYSTLNELFLFQY